MTSSPFLRRFIFAILPAVAAAQVATKGRVEIAGAAQPQLTANGQGQVWVAYGQGREVVVARSDDNGRTFSAGTTVTAQPKLMLGMRRGPRITAHGQHVTVTLIAHELLAFHSSDGGRSWAGPNPINEVPTSAREGLHDLAADGSGNVFVTWLDLRNGKTELWGAESRDSGQTWGKNALIYRSPDKSICECCHPTALFDAEGNLAVMWRNSIQGARDMWMATRAAGADRFTEPRKIGEGIWTLNACPMDGGRIVALGGGVFASVWQRAGDIFFSPPTGAENNLGPGKQPVALAVGGRMLLAWQKGTALWFSADAGKAAPLKHADDARFPVLISLPGGGALLAFEQGPAKGAVKVVIEAV